MIAMGAIYLECNKQEKRTEWGNADDAEMLSRYGRITM